MQKSLTNETKKFISPAYVTAQPAQDVVFRSWKDRGSPSFNLGGLPSVRLQAEQ